MHIQQSASGKQSILSTVTINRKLKQRLKDDNEKWWSKHFTFQ